MSRYPISSTLFLLSFFYDKVINGDIPITPTTESKVNKAMVYLLQELESHRRENTNEFN